MRMRAAGAANSYVKELKAPVEMARETEKQHGTNCGSCQEEQLTRKASPNRPAQCGNVRQGSPPFQNQSRKGRPPERSSPLRLCHPRCWSGLSEHLGYQK